MGAADIVDAGAAPWPDGGTADVTDSSVPPPPDVWTAADVAVDASQPADQRDTDEATPDVAPSQDLSSIDADGPDADLRDGAPQDDATDPSDVPEVLDIEPDCVPHCGDAVCGPDGCGGSCGACGPDETCAAGQCRCAYEDCRGACCGDDESCSFDECCRPDCAGRSCGTDGCGGFCGACPGDETCDAGGSCHWAPREGRYVGSLGTVFVVVGHTVVLQGIDVRCGSAGCTYDYRLPTGAPCSYYVDAGASFACDAPGVDCIAGGIPQGTFVARFVSATTLEGQVVLVDACCADAGFDVQSFTAEWVGPATQWCECAHGCECQSDCSDRHCGGDGCGGSCGACPAAAACFEPGVCERTDCAGAPDGTPCNDADDCTARDACETGGCVGVPSDVDQDGRLDCVDNCVETPNPTQDDLDDDEIGDACDDDDDGDARRDDEDNCPRVANPDQADDDRDSLGNACDDDDDGDGVADLDDNCGRSPNPYQDDLEGDGIGDVCDDDDDGDGVRDVDDNCPWHANPRQTDANENDWGDDCESCPEGQWGAGAACHDLVSLSLAYFDPAFGVVDDTLVYPFEGWNQRTYTQPTAIGFYAMVLAEIVVGTLPPDPIPIPEARRRLAALVASLRAHQTDPDVGSLGLLPWLERDDAGGWRRASGPFGAQVATGDNANLSVSLANAAGALLALDGDAEASAIVADIEAFLEAQRDGYADLLDASGGGEGEARFRRGWVFTEDRWITDPGGRVLHHEYLGDEFRAGLLFLVLRYGLDDRAYAGLTARVRPVVLRDGRTASTIAPYDGGAFQILWPALWMPETTHAGYRWTHDGFVDIALDFARFSRQPGLLSAAWGPDGYVESAGLQALTVNPGRVSEETIASVYCLGPARMARPEAVDALLNRVLWDHPGLVSAHGLWEAVAEGGIVEQQATANVASFLLGLAGTGPASTGPANLSRYLEHNGLSARLEELWPPGEPRDLLGTAPAPGPCSSPPADIAVQPDGSVAVSVPPLAASACVFFSLDGADLSGRTLVFGYEAAARAGTARLELKRAAGSPDVIVEPIELVPTGTTVREVRAGLPATPALAGVTEVVLVVVPPTDLPPGTRAEWVVHRLDVE